MSTALPYSLYTLSGKDVRPFLQGQLTCDMRQIEAEHWRFAAYCTPQGKTLAVMAVLADGADYLLILPQALADNIIKRLKIFILRSDVRITASAAALYAIAGTSVREQTLSRASGALYLQGIPGIRLVISTAPPAHPLDHNAYLAARIAAGIAEIYPETADQFLPQMIDLQSIDALSLSKGCYVGQEAIARLQYKSVNRRLLATAQSDSGALPAPGDALASGTLRAGTVLAAARHNGRNHIQAVIQDRYLNLPLTGTDLATPFYFHPAHSEMS